MWRKPEYRDGCDDLVGAADPGRFARRSLLRAAVLGQRDSARAQTAAYESLLRPRPVGERTVMAGTVSDVSPHVLVVGTRDGEERLTLTPATAVWRGARVPATALRHGDRVIIRKGALRGQSYRAGPARRDIVERVWAEIGRATGTILEARPSGDPAFPGGPRGLELLVDAGPAKARRIVLIAREVYRQILVRFPRLRRVPDRRHRPAAAGLLAGAHAGHLAARLPCGSPSGTAAGEWPRTRPCQRDRRVARAGRRARQPARAGLPGSGPRDRL